MQGPIQSVEITYLVHATEDQEKVSGAVAKLFAPLSGPELEHLEGHFGNAIIRARLHLTGEEAAKAFGNLVGSMPRGLRKRVVDDVASFLDEHSALFIRLDKQALVSGSLALGSGDSIRVKVKPRAFLVKGGAPKFYSEMMEGA